LFDLLFDNTRIRMHTYMYQLSTRVVRETNRLVTLPHCTEAYNCYTHVASCVRSHHQMALVNDYMRKMALVRLVHILSIPL